MRNGNRGAALLLVVILILPLVMAACGKTVGDTIDDATITTRVKTALLNDSDIGALRIDVNTAGGVVTLSGDVKSKAEADRAVQVARTIQGVKDVRSSLRIGGQQATSLPPGRAPRQRRGRAASW
jgi:ABC-type Na+ efflux pump permease subunit